jgi:triosephosphate isomerase
MKRKLIVANWKMNLSPKDSRRFASALAALAKKSSHGWRGDSLDIVLCPSFSSLSAVRSCLAARRGRIQLGAQDCFWEFRGAFTGEESPLLLAELGVTYIIIGHSERRMNLGETDEMVEKKMRACVREKSLIPILCVGEKSEERMSKDRQQVIRRQILSAISSIRDLKPKRQFVIAYEPVWAIGTGTPCTARDCARMASFIRRILVSQLGSAYTRAWCRIIYGGSVSEKNIKSFVRRGVSDGALVGGASLLAREFYNLIVAAHDS